MDWPRARPSLSVHINASSGLWKGQYCGGLGLHVVAVVSPGAEASVQGHIYLPWHQSLVTRRGWEREEELRVGKPLGGPLVTQKPQG